MRITVRNNLQVEGITIHWHGLHMVDNFWNDGAAFVSQCPINGGAEFTYIVRADNSGTHWWHAHSGMARFDGLFGPLVVLEPEEIESKVTSIPLTIGDWFQTDSISFIANDPFRLGMNEYPGNGPVTCATPYRSFFGGLQHGSKFIIFQILSFFSQFAEKGSLRIFFFSKKFSLSHSTCVNLDPSLKVTFFCLDSFVVNGRGQFRSQEGFRCHIDLTVIKLFSRYFKGAFYNRRTISDSGERRFFQTKINKYWI